MSAVKAVMDAPSDEATRVGLCIRCAHTRRVKSDRGAVFYLCLRSKTDPRFPLYPRLPVLRCLGYEGREPGATTEESS